jgi:mycothiol synthase
MVWPERLLARPPAVVLAPGYRLRAYEPGDDEGWFRLMRLAFGEEWDGERLAPWLARILPDGWLFVVDGDGEPAVTAMACHNPAPLHPFGGELGWVAGDPAHAGRGLGLAVCAAVTARFLSASYRRIYLKTDDARLPAIRTYLKLGFVPFLFAEGMEDRWAAVCAGARWPYEPEAWAAALPEGSSRS